MGGRGGSSGLGSSGKLNSVQKAVENQFAESIKYERNPERLVKSPTFMSSLKDAIGKQAFDRDYEITIKQVDSMAQRIINKWSAEKAGVTRQKTEEEAKTEAAKKYFREHYDPNRPQREITSSTYERAVARTQRDVDNFLGVKRKRKKRR